MSKALNSFVGKTMRAVQMTDDETTKELLRCAVRCMNQAKAARQQDDLAYARVWEKRAQHWVRKARDYNAI